MLSESVMVLPFRLNDIGTTSGAPPPRKPNVTARASGGSITAPSSSP